MDIAFVTEGTYPHVRGGVGTWCDQILRGLPQHTFDIYAICGDEYVKPIYTPPSNVRSISFVPLWGLHAAPQARRERLTGEFEAAYAQLLSALLQPSLVDASGFVSALKTLHFYAQHSDLSVAFNHRRSVERLWSEWQEGASAPQTRTLLPLLPSPSLSDALHASMWLDHLLRPLAWPAPKADLTHATSNGLSTLMAFTAHWTYGTPCILTEHGMYLRERYFEYPRVPFTPALRAFLLRFQILLSHGAYQIAATVAPVSDYNRRWAIRNGGAYHDRIHPIYNGIEPGLFPPATNEPVVPTICWVGRIDPLKDVETLIQGFRLVRDAVPTAQLRLFGGVPVGNEAYGQRCQDLVDHLQLRAAVTFEGHVSKVADAYHAGHIVALTSISEGFPYTVIESMATGRCSVATDVGGVSEAIGSAGMVVAPRDPRAFAEACVKLLTNSELRQQMGRDARARVLELFTLERCLNTYSELYRTTVDSTQAEAAD